MVPNGGTLLVSKKNWVEQVKVTRLIALRQIKLQRELVDMQYCLKCFLPLLTIIHKTTRTSFIDDRTRRGFEHCDEQDADIQPRVEVWSGAAEKGNVVDEVEHETMTVFSEKTTVVSQHSFEPASRASDRRFRTDTETMTNDRSERRASCPQVQQGSFPQEAFHKVHKIGRPQFVKPQQTRSETCVSHEERRTSSVYRESRVVVSEHYSEEELFESVQTEYQRADHDGCIPGPRTPRADATASGNRDALQKNSPWPAMDEACKQQVISSACKDGKLKGVQHSDSLCSVPAGTAAAVRTNSPISVDAASVRSELQEKRGESRRQRVAECERADRFSEEWVVAEDKDWRHQDSHISTTPSPTLLVNGKVCVDLTEVRGDIFGRHSQNLAADRGVPTDGRTERKESGTRPPLRMHREREETTPSSTSKYGHIDSSRR